MTTPYEIGLRIAELEADNLALRTEVETLKSAAAGGLRIVCDNAHHDRGEGVCVHCVRDRIKEAAEGERNRIVAWAREKVRGHRDIAIKYQDAKNDEMASTHIAIETAYVGIVKEIGERT